MKPQLNIPAQPQNIYRIRKRNYDTVDIMDAVLEAAQHSQQYIKPFLPYLKGETVRETCRKIWDFLKNEITYKEDPEGWQMIKAPSQLWATKVGDCKSYSVFANAALQAFGIESFFRFAAYENQLDANHNPAIPTHVYVVAKDRTGQEIIIDGVWHSFDSEKLPIYKKYDRMSLVYIAGTGPRKTIGAVDLKNSDFSTTIGIQFFKEKIEDKLRIAAPAFIYLFADPMGLPQPARIKRDKAFKFYKEFQAKTQIKDEAFYRFVKDAIIEKLGKDPIALLPSSYGNYIAYKSNILNDAKAVKGNPPVYEKFPAGGFPNTEYGQWQANEWRRRNNDYSIRLERYNAELEKLAIQQFNLKDFDGWLADHKAARRDPDYAKKVKAAQDALDKLRDKLNGTHKVGIEPATVTLIVTAVIGIVKIISMLVSMGKADLPDIPADFDLANPDNDFPGKNNEKESALPGWLLPAAAAAATLLL
ncbi:MAG: transglutaminase domain-containing protein [Bacteroidia bacterium]